VEFSAAERLAINLFYGFMPVLFIIVMLSLLLAILIEHWQEEYVARQKLLKEHKETYFSYFQDTAVNTVSTVSSALGFHKCSGWWQSTVARRFRKKTVSRRSSFFPSKSLKAVKSTWEHGNQLSISLHQALSKVERVQARPKSQRTVLERMLAVLPPSVKRCLVRTSVVPMAECASSFGSSMEKAVQLGEHWYSAQALETVISAAALRQTGAPTVCEAMLGSAEWHKRNFSSAAAAAFRRFSEAPPPRALWNNISRIAASPKATAELMAAYRDTAAIVHEMTDELASASDELILQLMQSMQQMTSELQPQQRPRSRHQSSRPSSAAPRQHLSLPHLKEHLLEDASITPHTRASPVGLPGYLVNHPTNPSPTATARSGLHLVVKKDDEIPTIATQTPAAEISVVPFPATSTYAKPGGEQGMEFLSTLSDLVSPKPDGSATEGTAEALGDNSVPEESQVEASEHPPRASSGMLLTAVPSPDSPKLLMSPSPQAETEDSRKDPASAWNSMGSEANAASSSSWPVDDPGASLDEDIGSASIFNPSARFKGQDDHESSDPAPEAVWANRAVATQGPSAELPRRHSASTAAPSYMDGSSKPRSGESASMVQQKQPAHELQGVATSEAPGEDTGSQAFPPPQDPEQAPTAPEENPAAAVMGKSPSVQASLPESGAPEPSASGQTALSRELTSPLNTTLGDGEAAWRKRASELHAAKLAELETTSRAAEAQDKLVKERGGGPPPSSNAPTARPWSAIR